MRKVEKKQIQLVEIINERDFIEGRRQRIAEVVERMNKQNTFINSAQAVHRCLEPWDQADSDMREIRSVMKLELGMRYRKIVPVSL